MAERVLCENELRVAVDGGGERTLVVVQDGTTVRFWTDTRAMEDVLRGGFVQLSAYDGYCAIAVEGDRTSLEFGLERPSRKRCEFPTRDLAAALGWVRTLPTPALA